MKTCTLRKDLRLLSILLIAGSQVMFGQVTNINTGFIYSTIQAAIDDPLTLNGHTLVADPGVYEENVLVDKELTINGPKMGVDGNSGSRGTGEAIIYPPSVWYGDGTYNGGYLMRITADNVIVDGFTFDGDNPSLEGAYSTSTGAFDVDFGIMSYWSPWYDLTDMAGNNLIIQNNVLKNFKFSAIMMWAAFEGNTASSTILHNKIQNTASNPAINLAYNYYADIEYNTIIDAYIGVFTYLDYNPDPTGTGGSIRDNTISLSTIETNWGDTYTQVTGILYTFIYAFADPWNISNNTITNSSLASAGSAGIIITIEATEDPMVVSNNDISGFEYGYRLSTNYFTTTISGGNLINNRYGAAVSNYDFNGNYPAQPSDFTLSGINIENSLDAGVFLEDHPSSLSGATVNANVYNCFINGAPMGIYLNSPVGSATAHDNDLSDNDFAIYNSSTSTVDATCNWYGHWTGPVNDNNPGGTGTEVSGPATFDPWVTNGTDDDGSMDGFQPVPGSCVPIKCGNNDKKYLFCHSGKTKCVGYDDALIHLAHGDPFGACPEELFGYDPGSVIADISEVSLAPNPFTNVTSFTFDLPFNGNVSLKIYDVMGEEIASLIDGDNTAGIYSLNFDASGLSNGIYYFRLYATSTDQELIQSGKMIKQ